MNDVDNICASGAFCATRPSPHPQCEGGQNQSPNNLISIWHHDERLDSLPSHTVDMASILSSPSVAGSPKSATSILTPTRKVQALLAQYDDSDSEDDAPTRPPNPNHEIPKSHEVVQDDASKESQADPEDEDILIPRRQLAKEGVKATTPDQSQPKETANERPESWLNMAKDDKLFSSSEEDAVQQSPSAPKDGPATGSRSPSPLFFPSPAGRKSKFLALVEKHKKQRVEKEAEEAAKQAQRLQNLKSPAAETRRPRGSSPADDTDEDSDNSERAGGQRFSTQARPTRKASKKALEEMNRETQRISRNMQLAHQARTKKKITKDSLLARFNFPVASSNAARESELSATSSSPAPSEKDALQRHETPPTSPIADVATPKLDKGQGRALSLEPVEHEVYAHPPTLPGSDVTGEQQLKPTIKASKEPVRTQPSSSTKIWSDNDDSESDLEVITSKGDMRKYAAFEHLRIKKAKEAPSHIALRSLANLIGEDRKKSVNAAEMEASLRKKARNQAREERQQRINELKAKGVVIQTGEEREREQQEVEDLLEIARREATDIQKREKAAAKKEGNYTKDALGEDSSDDEEDDDFTGDDGDDEDGESELEEENDLEQVDEEDPEDVETAEKGTGLLDNEAEERQSDASPSPDSATEDEIEQSDEVTEEPSLPATSTQRRQRQNRIVSDDEDEAVVDQVRSPQLPTVAKTPQSLTRSAKKQIPGLQMSDDLPIGLTQAFAATMADSQSQDLPATQEHDSFQMTADLPSPKIAMAPKLYRLDSIDMISDSQPASPTQPLEVNLSFTQSQIVPQSPIIQSAVSGLEATPSQRYFEPTQDAGYVMSPFIGNRFASKTPQRPHSTLETVIMPDESQTSPIVQRKARLRRGRINADESDEEATEARDLSAFDVMQRAAQEKSRETFDKDKSNARGAFDEAAEESEDEYAGLGGASDDEANDEENEEDRKMIDEDTQVGIGDEAKLAKLFADREREQDEAAVSKLMKDITTGALRRKRGNDDLDLSDEEDAAVRRREAKRREFAKMRRELLKDEAVGKIAEDKKKEAFLRSIEDRPESEDGDDFNQPETQDEEDPHVKDSQNGSFNEVVESSISRQSKEGDSQPLATTGASKLNQSRTRTRQTAIPLNKRPGTLAEIRDSVSFLIDEPDSQAGTIDLGLSDSEDEPEAYVDLDRHLRVAEADENADDADDLGDFIVDDDGQAQDTDETFKKPALPLPEPRAPFSERRTQDRTNVVNRLNILRQASSSGSSTSTKMAFYSASTYTSATGSFNKVPALLRRATTNSSLGSMAGRDENVSATGVVTSKSERGGDEKKNTSTKEFVRKGSRGRSTAVNYRPTIREEKMSARAGVGKKSGKGKKGAGGFLGGLFGGGGGSWA